ncbi:MAG TPA: Asp-tRNA(Asn)/Glu-tRNA(Gln) amidotransferase subunit GatC [Acidobacteriaceae bacterium]|nr:Asp-tRNA(Asn)/Glu-tRNA(Gln) amidotransferase subunit GatC [Acidobacteriaceae bacterium]
MPETEKVSLEDVRRVAELGYLELTPDEETRMQRDLNAILGYVAQLGELDTADVVPMAQVAELLDNGGDVHSERAFLLRDDVPRPCLPHENAMAAAPETDGVFFKVPKVIER